MNGSQLNSATKAYGMSMAVSCLLSALLVVAKETNAGLMAMMKTVTIHHWVSHIVFITGVFLILGFILSKSRDGKGVNISDSALLKAVVGSIALGATIITVFFLAEL